ncbi:MAG TPA: hypothetical protein RMH99_24270 [Sandaracinaceae bacterium LLY-WYZ-13_1]|nr:hypothetical protein [Sandaracinaceae bacterium LLY-WYZ-13_1]
MRSRSAAAAGLALALAACGSAPPPSGSEVVVRVRVRDDLCPPGGCGAPEPPAPPPVCAADGPQGLRALDLAAGMAHACAVLSDGHVRCWGANYESSLGNGRHGASATPVTVRRVEGAQEVSAGRYHACARVEGGRVWCWGRNDWAALGTGDRRTPSPWLPVEVGRLRRVEQVAAGRDHTCARLRGGAVRCWGRNHRGQLGDGTTSLRARPSRVRGLRASHLAAGGDSSCAVRTDGGVACWGRVTGTERPVSIRGLPSPAVHVAVGDGAACTRLVDGRVWCWGDGTHGTLGPAERSASESAVRVEGLPPARALTMGAHRGCIVSAQGRVWCWGGGATFDRASARPRQRDLLSSASEVAVSRAATCARLDAGGVCCWGSNRDGLLGVLAEPFRSGEARGELPVPLAW